jgi:glycosyltransferase involved in cell wall biosynthesis
MPTISVTIITRNEAENIRACLESVAFADEIIVIDSGSEDETLTICKEFTEHVFTDTDWQGFGIQKNRALQKASSDWILSLDADEIVPTELAEEIKEFILGKDQMALLPRLSTFCGREIRHSGWYPDYVARLFPRDKARFSDDQVHEKLIHDLPEVRLTTPLKHNTAPDLDDVLKKMNRYTSLSAAQKHANGKSSSLFKAIGHGLWAFLWSYFGRKGFLDGREGFILAVTKAENSYYRYLKLMYLNEKK